MTDFEDAHRELEQAEMVLELAQANYQEKRNNLMKVALDSDPRKTPKVGFGPA